MPTFRWRLASNSNTRWIRHRPFRLRPAGIDAPRPSAAIGDRAARIRLTEEILRAFEPAIRQHAEQWYHFVPVWAH